MPPHQFFDRRAVLGGALATAGLLTGPPPAHGADTSGGGFTPELFERWIDARLGTGAPVYWHASGTAKLFPSGSLAYYIEGVEAMRMYRPDPQKALVHQYSRKIYFVRGINSETLLSEPWFAHGYQFITYELKNDKVETYVEQGYYPTAARSGPNTSMRARVMDDAIVFTAPTFFDAPAHTETGRYQAFENTDLFVAREASANARPRLSWVRYGPLSGVLLDGPASIIHAVSTRLETWGEVPARLRTHVESTSPEYQAPPKDLLEIRTYQSPKPDSTGEATRPAPARQ